MGGEQSTPQNPKVGYHVLQVQTASPGSAAGLISYFDFIVAAEGVLFDKEDTRFVDILRANVGKPIRLVVYNLKTETARDTSLTPSNTWGGNGLAGISIRFCSFEHATDNVWHILDVYPNSPAEKAGLRSRLDYIVGTPDLLLNDQEDLFSVVDLYESKSKSLPIYVYGEDTDSIRLLSILPNRKWGGIGSLGCDIGYGYLHRIPINRNITSSSTTTIPIVQQQQQQQEMMIKMNQDISTTSTITTNILQPIDAAQYNQQILQWQNYQDQPNHNTSPLPQQQQQQQLQQLQQQQQQQQQLPPTQVTDHGIDTIASPPRSPRVVQQ